MSDSSRAIRAGLLYFVGVFATGFAFGAIRLMLLVPTLGETVAVLVETPFILGVSWLLCARAIGKFAVSVHFEPRLVMGVVALVCLLLAEFALWVGMFGNPAETFLPRYQTLAGMIGLLGQLLYAAFPLLQAWRDRA